MDQKNMLTRSFWYFQQLIKTDTLPFNKFYDAPFLIQGWSEKGKGSGLTRTPDSFRMAPVHTGWAEGGLAGSC